MPQPDGLRAAALLAAARCLLEAAPQDRDSAHARRAVSTAYYAMFHCLALICADRLGNGRAVRLRPTTRRVVYRALQHGRARRRCQNRRLIAAYPDAVREFAKSFAEIQTARHRADYDPSASVSASEARRSVNTAERLIRAFENAPDADLRDFALRVLLPERED